MYQNPMAQGAAALNIDDKLLRDHFEEFYEDVFEEFSQFGKIDAMHVMDNLSDQLVGNVYCMFDDEEGAAKALTSLNGRFYAGRPIMAEFSPVTDFHEARCRQFDEAVCSRGGQCNFMHIKKLSPALCRRIKIEVPLIGRPKGGYDDYDGGKGGGGGGGRDRDRDRDRHDERRSSRRDDERRSSRREGGGGEERRSERRSERREGGGGEERRSERRSERRDDERRSERRDERREAPKEGGEGGGDAPPAGPPPTDAPPAGDASEAPAPPPRQD